MQNDFIAVIDSGIGGISVLKALTETFPNERFLYYGDNNNAPYGNRSVQNLLSLTMKNVDYIKFFGVKAIVVACNTLSVNLLTEIKEYSSLPVFGTFPPVEKNVLKGKKTLLLSTVRTAELYRGIKNLDTVGLPTLVKHIEYNKYSLDSVNFEKALYEAHVGDFIDKKGYYDTVILGCTHYYFIKNKILDHFCPQNVDCGHDLTIKSLGRFLLNNKSLVNNKRFEILFVGDCGVSNKYFWEKSGQSS